MKKELDIQKQQRPLTVQEMEKVEDFKDLMRGQSLISKKKQSDLKAVAKAIDKIAEPIGLSRTQTLHQA